LSFQSVDRYIAMIDVGLGLKLCNLVLDQYCYTGAGFRYLFNCLVIWTCRFVESSQIETKQLHHELKI